MFDVCLVSTAGATWEQQWSYLLCNFKPRRLYVIGELDSRVRPFVGHTRVDSAALLPGPLVTLAPPNGVYIKGEESLIGFEHPEGCCYLFGPDDAHLTLEHLGGRDADHLVYVPTDTDHQMYSFIAGSVVLYDRLVKHG